MEIINVTGRAITAAIKVHSHFGALHSTSGVVHVVNGYEVPTPSAYSAPPLYVNKKALPIEAY